jgi:predicted kinase
VFIPILLFPSRHHTVVNTQRWRQRIIVIFVGLPARGKSYLAYKVVNFFRWKGFSAELFNVGKYRRQQKEEEEFHDASFFDAKNEGASQERERLAMCVLRQMLDWLRDGNGSIAVFDATNTTRARRQAIVNVCNKEGSGNLPVVFVESICDDPVVLHENYRIKVSKSPDYKGMQEKEALADLKKRVAMYEKVYEPIKETEELSYIKIRNLRAQLVINNIFGRLPQLLCVFLMSLHVVRRPIYLCRAGSSDNGR